MEKTLDEDKTIENNTEGINDCTIDFTIAELSTKLKKTTLFVTRGKTIHI